MKSKILNGTKGLARSATPLTIFLTLLIVTSGALVTAEFLLNDLPLVAVAAVLGCAAFVLLAWKIQFISITVRELQRRKPPITAPRQPLHTPIASIPTQTEKPRRDTAEKLCSVGSYTPTSPAGGGSAPGRHAAKVSADPDAPYRLFASTGGYGTQLASPITGRRIALIGSPSLESALQAHGDIQRLHPSVTEAQLMHAQPSTLVIEEDALAQGPWAGALEPHGTRLLNELRVCMAWMRSRAGLIYVIPAKGLTPLAAAALRADTTVVDDIFKENHGADGPASLLDALIDHNGRKGSP